MFGNPQALDFETRLIEPGKLAPLPVCLSYAGPGGSGLLHCGLEEEATVAKLKEALEGVVIGARVAFDMAVALEHWWDELREPIFRAYEENRILDVQLAQKLIDNAHGCLGGYMDPITGKKRVYGYSLAALETRHLAIDRSEQKGTDAWRMRYHELEETPISEWPEDAVTYPIDDAVGTLKVWEHVVAGNERFLIDLPNQCRAAFALHLMQCWGIHTDPEQIEIFAAETNATYERLSDLLKEEGLVRANGSRNTKAAKARMVDYCKAHEMPVKTTKTGQDKFGYSLFMPDADAVDAKYVSLDAEACERCVEDPVLLAYGERTSLQTTVGSRIPDLRLGVDTPIQSEFNPMVETGRTSCRKGRILNGFQLQNPPRKGMVRECFVARPGHVFALVDFDGLELCTMAQVCVTKLGYSKLGHAINEGLDPHLALGAELIGADYKWALENKREPKVRHARQCAKVANFGFPGGLGVNGFLDYARSGYGVHLTVREATELKERWIAKWDEFKLYFEWIRNMCNGPQGCAEVVQLFSGRVRGLVPYTAACNSFFQGLGADGAKFAQWCVTRECYANTESPLFGARPVIFLHDEIITEVEEDRAHEQAHHMCDVMVEACNVFLPDVPTKAEPALSKHWRKDAETVFDAEGRLIPWDSAGPRYWADGSRL